MTNRVSGTAPFDVCGPLPAGLTLLEASAGTGKTFTIAALVARYIAAGVPVDQLLVVTFTRMATGELRSRVRQRLTSAEHGLRLALANRDPGGDDVVTSLATGPTEEVDRRRRRLAVALADYDAATIVTTHGFCENILASLGTAGDVGREVRFLVDIRELVTEVVDDLYLRKFARAPGVPPFSRLDAIRIGWAAVSNPEAPIEPVDAPDEPAAEMRARLAVAVRREVHRRKLATGALGYDDLLTRLADTLRSPEGAVARRRLRERYRVALVDEFQDTDTIQWDILRLAFDTDAVEAPTPGCPPGPALVLIGDPKQAIYSFRGADVWSYLDAAQQATTRATLGTNWRSDAGLVRALDALLSHATLGHPDIAYHRVEAAPAHTQPGLDQPGAPLQVRVVHQTDGQMALTYRGLPTKPAARQVIAADLAGEIVDLLQAAPTLVERDDEGSEMSRQSLRPNHLAVLVPTNLEARVVFEALDRAGVPAVLNAAGSVAGTLAATHWMALLEALERPGSSIRARVTALTPWIGWTTEGVATADDTHLAQLQARLHHWATVLSTEGVSSLLALITTTEALEERILGRAGGERLLTDLRHIGQLLHAEAMRGQLGPTALASWWRERIAEAGIDVNADERTRRLDSDADAVQVITIHRSKGLEFPVVYLPYLWSATFVDREPNPVYHDAGNDLRRTVDVGGPSSPGQARHATIAQAEAQGESLRRAYVALTRARHLVVLWWVGVEDSCRSALGRLLFRGDNGEVTTVTKAPSDQAVLRRLDELIAEAPGCISVGRVDGRRNVQWSPPPMAAEPLAVSEFDRNLDTEWRRTSYSAITAAAHEGSPSDRVVSSEPESAGVADEPVSVPVEATMAPVTALVSPMAGLPRGPHMGTLVHAVFEAVDFAAADLGGALMTAVATVAPAHTPVPELDPAALAGALQLVIETPLGPAPDALRLRDVSRTDRLDELNFELPLVGGDTPTAELTIAALAQPLRAGLPADDPLTRYPDRLSDPSLTARLRGYLTGSIDVVLRTGGRFVVVDYKTNWLGGVGSFPQDTVGEASGPGALSTWDYRPVALVDAMEDAHYPLQALLYSVALHRYLRWRLPGYRPQEHLGGVLYLFVRGMAGAATPTIDGERPGVFRWAPAPGLIMALSDLFDRGVPST